MKTFNELFEMYSNHAIIHLSSYVGVDFNALYTECDKYPTKYQEFKQWLEYLERNVKSMLVKESTFLEED